jgi:hypothetical protein
VLIGAPNVDGLGHDARPYSGAAYVIYGDDDGFGAGIDLAALTPDRGFKIAGADIRDGAGFSVSAAGDVDGDGYDDVVVGTLASKSYVIYGGDFTAAGAAQAPALRALDVLAPAEEESPLQVRGGADHAMTMGTGGMRATAPSVASHQEPIHGADEATAIVDTG